MSKIALIWKNISNALGAIKFFVQLSFKYDKWYVVCYLPLVLINTITPFVGILFPKYIIDAIQEQRSIQMIAVLIIAMFAARFFLSLFAQILYCICEKKMVNIRTGMRIFLNQKTLFLEYEKIENPVYLNMKKNAAECIDKNYDVGLIANNVASFCSTVFTLFGLFAIISTLNIWTIILILAVTGIDAYAKSRQANQTYYFRKSFSTIARKLFYIIGITWDYKYAKDIRCFNLREWLNEKKQDYLKQTSGNSIKIFILSTVISLVSIVTSSIQQLLIYLYLVWAVLKNAITIGDFTMYLSAISQFSTTLSSVINSCISVAEASNYMKDYVEFCRLETSYGEKKEDIVLGQGYEVEFRDVSFVYPGQEEAALKHVSLKIRQNEKLSIVGENGAGKSTFVKLLMRLYKPTSGKILLNGVDIQEMDLSSYTQLISAVFQDYKMLAFSLKENICGYDVDDERLKQVLENVGLADRMLTMKNSFDTNLSRAFDPDGTELSGGEQQKVAIAQALYKNTPIIILDEPTSNLSPIAEYELYKQFHELVADRTALFISHRLSSCRFCDKIVVFTKGEIAEYGSHEELMSLEGIYESMFSTQAQYYTST